jgi:hypothetical protein
MLAATTSVFSAPLPFKVPVQPGKGGGNAGR